MSHTAAYITPISAASITSANLTFDAQGLITAATTGTSSVLATQNQSVLLSAAVSTLDFVGAGVVASGAGAITTVNVTRNSLISVTLTKTNVVAYVAGAVVEWNVVVSDPLGMYNNGTGGAAGTAAITIPSTGNYLIVLQMLSTTPNPQFNLTHNGVSIMRNAISFPVQQNVAMRLVYPLTSGDVLRSIGDNAFGSSGTASVNNFSVTKIE